MELSAEQKNKINALIAEKVMHFQRHSDPETWLVWSEVDQRHVFSGWWATQPETEQDEYGDAVISNLYRLAGDAVWNPVENIAAARAVIAHMQTVHGFAGHNGFLLTCDEKGWYCEFPNPSWQDAVAGTLELAICLAALKAVGVEL